LRFVLNNWTNENPVWTSHPSHFDAKKRVKNDNSLVGNSIRQFSPSRTFGHQLTSRRSLSFPTLEEGPLTTWLFTISLSALAGVCQNL
jgi:hypothetical protein